MIGFDVVVGVLLDDMAGGGQQLIKHPRVGGCPVGGDLDGALGALSSAEEDIVVITCARSRPETRSCHEAGGGQWVGCRVALGVASGTVGWAGCLGAAAQPPRRFPYELLAPAPARGQRHERRCTRDVGCSMRVGLLAVRLVRGHTQRITDRLQQYLPHAN
jgi:hypothetical protein